MSKEDLMGWFFSLYVRMIQLENCWMDLDEILVWTYAIQVYSKVVLAHWMGQSPLGRAEHEGLWRWGVPEGPGVVLSAVSSE
jgi:hypothetical protein